MAAEKRSYRPTAETRELLAEKALELMKKYGYRGTTVRAICSSLGLPTGTFYNCFKTKNDVFRGLYAMGDGYFENVLRPQLDGLSFPQQLDGFAAGYAKVNYDTGLELMRVLFNTENTWFTQTRPMQQLLLDIIKSGADTGFVSKAASPETLVSMIFDTLRGVCYDWCVTDGGFDMAQRMAAHIRLMLPGLKEASW